ncbi:hypothetical protein RND71_036825 [Anisodus tanguticus]|uniref:Uncharacterized protein n=1 Tax=Anisodus tanguticus TaxID=243964 RepID=A0AAE1R2H3_9SOLA|nr:hypothetical protein RND71_036825 [Anisodus tanguticus]
MATEWGQNTSYFHKVIKERLRKLCYHKIQSNEGHHIEGHENIANASINHFEELKGNFKCLGILPKLVTKEMRGMLTTTPSSQEESKGNFKCLGILPKLVTKEMRGMLTTTPSSQEVRNAVKDIDRDDLGILPKLVTKEMRGMLTTTPSSQEVRNAVKDIDRDKESKGNFKSLGILPKLVTKEMRGMLTTTPSSQEESKGNFKSLGILPKLVTKEMRGMLTTTPSSQEVRNVVKDIDRDKGTRPLIILESKGNFKSLGILPKLVTKEMRGMLTTTPSSQEESKGNFKSLGILPKLVTKEMRGMLTTTPSSQEVRNAVKDIDRDSAPGPRLFWCNESKGNFKSLGILPKLVTKEMRGMLTTTPSSQEESKGNFKSLGILPKLVTKEMRGMLTTTPSSQEVRNAVKDIDRDDAPASIILESKGNFKSLGILPKLVTKEMRGMLTTTPSSQEVKKQRRRKLCNHKTRDNEGHHIEGHENIAMLP